MDERFEGSDDLESAVKQVVLLVLKSPRFLYLGIGRGELDDYDIASRLSFGLWDSLPDEEAPSLPDDEPPPLLADPLSPEIPLLSTGSSVPVESDDELATIHLQSAQPQRRLRTSVPPRSRRPRSQSKNSWS